MITIPIFGDQFYHARRAEYKGYGLTLDIFKFTPNELKSKMSKIIGNETYTKRMRKVSEFFKYDLENSKPSDKVADAVDKLLQFGDEHLVMNADHLETYQTRMWDFVALATCGLTICIFILLMFLKSCLRIGKIGHPKSE